MNDILLKAQDFENVFNFSKKMKNLESDFFKLVEMYHNYYKKLCYPSISSEEIAELGNSIFEKR